MNTFTFNGHTSDEFGIRIERMPVLNRPARKFRAASVPGRNGNIYELEDAWEEIIQPYEIFAGGMNNGDAVPSFTDIMEWLHSANGYAVLSDTYDLEHYRMAAFVDSADIESQWHTWGRAVINFRCRPEHYLTGQTSAVASGAVINNTTKHIAKPVITLTGGGACNLLKMQGRTAATVLTGNPTNYIRGISGAYIASGPTVDGSKVTFGSVNDSTGTLTFQTTTSDYGIGFPMGVEPNTEYTLFGGFNFSGELGKIIVYYYGYNRYLGRADIQSASDMTLTFKTPSECRYIIIAFTLDKVSTSQSFTSIMLNKGSTAKPFKAYNASISSTLKINNTTMTIAESYASAVIDCDKENVVLDGVASNQNVTIVDQYGNISEEYLQLAKGNNTITYSGDITACSIDTKMWNL